MCGMPVAAMIDTADFPYPQPVSAVFLKLCFVTRLYIKAASLSFMGVELSLSGISSFFNSSSIMLIPVFISDMITAS